MATKLNLHRLMGPDDGFLRAIRVPDTDEKALAAAREKIRDTLRQAFHNWERFVTKAELRDHALATGSVAPRLLTPKFRIQGSFAYHTANDCQDPPEQQIDQDDGVFLPISFVTVAGRVRPTIAAETYFALVERALRPLCERNGWILNPGETKNSCVRVELGSRLHIDLPLYAIRDGAFEELVEAAAFDSLTKSISLRDSLVLDDEIYRNLAHAEIILAHRRQGWIESDPRRLETWFSNAVKLYGPVVRELSRCFKGLRDAQFDEGLTSICIMASVVRAVEHLSSIDPKRLDVCIVRVAREMARLAGRPVENPVFPGDQKKLLCEGWSDNYRERVRALFNDTADQLEEAIDGTFHKQVALDRARRAFGPRVPEREDLIALVTAADAVRNVPPQRQPSPVVPRTKSG